MSNRTHTAFRSLRFRRLWKPTLAAGGGSTAIAIWFEEIIAFAGEFIGVILLPIVGALIYLFDNFIFKSRVPRRDDLQDTTNKGVRK
jgi:hypothetical protein